MQRRKPRRSGWIAANLVRLWLCLGRCDGVLSSRGTGQTGQTWYTKRHEIRQLHAAELVSVQASCRRAGARVAQAQASGSQARRICTRFESQRRRPASTETGPWRARARSKQTALLDFGWRLCGMRGFALRASMRRRDLVLLG